MPRAWSRRATRLVIAAAALLVARTVSACTECTAPLETLPRPMSAYQTRSGATTSSCPSNFYAIPLVAGRLIELTTCSPGTSTFDTIIRLRTPTCTVAASNDDSCGLSSRVLLLVTATGTWTVEVTGFGSSFGNYLLAWRTEGEGSSPSECVNGLDDDGNGMIDCADPGCTDDLACPETCANGVDDDADGLADCADPECSDDAACPEDCGNGLDDDADTLVDCASSECAGDPRCQEAGNCADGRDDDLDGWMDCSDTDCVGDPLCPHVVRPVEEGVLRLRRTGDDVELRWDGATRDMAGQLDRVLDWRVYRGDAPDFVPDLASGSNRVLDGVPLTSAIDPSTARDGRNHYWLVTPVDIGSLEGNSRPAKVSAPALTLTATPGGLEATWTAAEPGTELAGYRLYRGLAPRQYVERIDAGLARGWDLPGLEPDVFQYLAVSALDRSGNETPLSGEVASVVGGRGTLHAMRQANPVFLGPAPSFGWEPRAPVDFPPMDWTRGTLTVTLDSGLAAPCDCAGAGHCGGDELAHPVSVFLVEDERCLDTADTCIRWDETQLELLRAFTPMGTDARTGPRVLSVDVTPFRQLLRGRKVVGLNLPTWLGEGWHADVDFTFSSDPADASPKPPADGVAPLFFREGIVADNQELAQPSHVTIPSAATRVVMRLWVSGEGAGDPAGRPECTGPADEFCRKTHHLVVDGSDAWSAEVWRDCSAACEDWNACGGATCGLSRAGWCPGEVTCHSPGACDQDIDVTAAFPPGEHDVVYRIDDPTPGGSWGCSVALYWYY